MHGIEIIFEDANWIIVNKPPGMMSQGGNASLPNVLSVLRLQKKQMVARTRFLSCVHRLDTNVSGVMAVAKNPRAARSFHQQLQDGVVIKRYVALVGNHSRPLRPQTWLNQGVKRNKKLHLYSFFERFVGNTNACILTIKNTMSLGCCQRLEIELLTGVFHQIRAQCSWHGYPILGDVKYGGVPDPKDRIFLHAVQLCFCIKADQVPRTFESSVPQSFQNVCVGQA